MYESYYGLTDKPFQLNPDPSFYFGSRQHRRAMAYLDYGMHQNEGFIVVTGEVGAGKTTLVRNLLGKLDPDKVVAAHLVSTQLDADDTLRLVSAAFGLPTVDAGKSDVLLTLEAFLVNVSRQGKRGLLIVDEAQNLSPRAVEELRMLSNFQLETHALLQSFLIGQPEFRRTMQSPHMQQLRQRVIAACHLGPMEVDETCAYIQHRLQRAGYRGRPLFPIEVGHAVHQATDGIPRRINSVCDRLLLAGYLGEKREFTPEDVAEVAREIREETCPTLPPANGHHHPQILQAGVLDIDLSRLELDPKIADAASSVIAGLQSNQLEERLQRLERVSAATLQVLQTLVDAVKARQGDQENKR